jgi:ABC-type antimicrobial peptide transport system permease subunit
VAVPAAGIDMLQGHAYPTLLEGRPAQGPTEIVLGSTSLRRLGRVVGDTVSVEVAGFLVVDEDLRPADVSNYERVQSTPVVLAGLLVALAVAALAHTLVTWVRQRRRDLGVLRALGFVRGQVAASVAWQSSTLAGLALLVGLPLGVVAGRWLWLVFARQLGVALDVTVPLLPLLAAIPLTLALASLVAVVPGLSARRSSPAAALRTE